MISNESPAASGHHSPAPSGGQPAAWAPDSCTLPTAERPLRGAEFSAAFADLVRRAERPDPGRLRLELARTPQAAGRIAELAARETECCSFFAFTLTVTGSALTLDITVPPAHVPVLDALAERAGQALAGGTSTGGLSTGGTGTGGTGTGGTATGGTGR